MTATERFVVGKFSGYPIGADGEHMEGRRFGHAKTTFYVYDTLRLYEVVAAFENPPRPRYGQSLAYLRRRAEKLAARLNELD
jgi:hypothetical protein